MSLDAKISALTASLRSEFWKAWQETAVPAAYEKFTQTLPSTTKIENFVNTSPVPGMSEWFGQRNYGQVDSFIYQIRNKTFTTGIKVTLEDLEDDQVNFISSKAKELTNKARKFPGRLVLKTLSAGASTLGIDGSNFFASSHNFGSGNNALTFTGNGNSDSNTYKLAALYTGDQLGMKPMIWLNRSGPEFGTNSGTPQSKESRQVRYWCDLRGAAAPGYWMGAIMVTITNLPSIGDMHAIYQNITNQFRTFQLPKSATSDDGEYLYEQEEFNSGNIVLVGSPALENLLRQSLNQDWVPQSGNAASNANFVATTNLWKGFASYMVSNFF